MANKRTNIIDGNFMLMRFLRDYDFMSDPIKDRIGLLTDLSQHIACEIERIKPFCDNIYLCKDNRSWRKDIHIVQPLELVDPNTNKWEVPKNVGEYKSNRKKSADCNWELIYSTFMEFCECLNRDFDVPLIQCDGAEGDDCIWATTTILRKNKIKTCVTATDSDLNQLVTPSNVIIRRIKSKAAPEGEIVVHKVFWDMFTNATDKENPLSLFNFDVTKWAPDMEMVKNKSVAGGSIVISKPFWFILVHMFVGSVKDNVPELFTWPAKSINRHIGTKHIIEALSYANMKPDDITEDMLYDEAFLKATIINVCHATKQTQFIEHVDYLYELLVCNRKLNYLSEKEIPETVQNDLFNIIKAQFFMQADMKNLSNSNLIMEKLHISNDKTFQNLGI